MVSGFTSLELTHASLHQPRYLGEISRFPEVKNEATVATSQEDSDEKSEKVEHPASLHLK